MSEGSGKQTCSTEDLGAPPWTNNHLTIGLQGGPKRTVNHVLDVPHGYQLGLPRISAKSIPAEGSPESLISNTHSFLPCEYIQTCQRRGQSFSLLPSATGQM